MSNKIIVPGLCLCLLLSSFTFLISSCRHNPKKIDVSGIKLEARVLRLDRDFYELSGNNAKEQVKAMQKKYGDFFQLFVGHPNFLNYNYARLDSLGTLADSLLYYRHDPVVQMIFDTTENHYKNFKPIEEEMTNALRHYHYYYPSKPVPVFIPMLVPVLQGNHAFTYEDNIISANLFYYLGANCSFYQQGADPEPRFLVWKYTPAFLVPDCMNALAQLFVERNRNPRCIDDMIWKGKIKYFASCMMPDAPDSVILGFHEKQLESCELFEDKIFQYYIQHKLLYSTDALEYDKLLNDAPNTSDMPIEIPGNTGTWLGYRIVSKFMKENPQVTLQQLMTMTNGQEILEKGKYRP